MSHHDDLETIATGGAHFAMTTNFHVGGSLSPVEFLTSLYFSGDHKFDVGWRNSPDRDKYIHSKGHTASALWFFLWLHGCLGDMSLDELTQVGTFGHRLDRMPQRDVNRGIEMTTGSLGQGLSYGCGIALADRRAARASHTFVLLGDAECSEGQVWEAAQTAIRLGLANLTVAIDANGFGSHMATDRDRLLARWRGFGWAATEIDGHDLAAVTAALRNARDDGAPSAIILMTEKGHRLAPPYAGTFQAGGGVPAEYRPAFDLACDVQAALDVVDRRLPGARTARGVSMPEAAPPELVRDPISWDPDRHAKGQLINTKTFASELAERLARESNLLIASPDAIRNSGLMPLLDRDQNWSWENPSSSVLEHAIAEQDLASLAAGATSVGLRTVVFLMEGFVWRMLDSLRQSVCFPGLPVVIVSTSAGIGEDLGPMAQGDSCFAAISAMHGWTILEASDVNDAKALFNEALSETRPVYLRLPTEPLPVLADLGSVTSRDMTSGAWTILDDDDPDVVIVTAGSMVPTSLAAAARLRAEHDICSRVVNLFSISRFAASSAAQRDLVLPPGVPTISVHNAPASIFAGLLPAGATSLGIEGYGWCGGPPTRLYEASGLGVDDVVRAANGATG